MISHKSCLQKTQTYLLTNEHLPRSSPHLQANKPTAGTLDFHLLNSLPINTACPNPESTCMQLTTTCFSRTGFFHYSQINTISGTSSLPQFTSLFRLTKSLFHLIDLFIIPNFLKYMLKISLNIGKIQFLI